MKKQIMQLVVLFSVVCLLTFSSKADMIYKVTFDNLSTGTAPNTFTIGTGEISPAAWNAYTPNQNVIVSTPQGKGLEVVPGDWSNGPFCGYKLGSNSTQTQLTQPGDGVTYEVLAQFDNVTGKVFYGGWNLYAEMHIIADSGDNAYLYFGNGTSTAITDSLPICDGEYHHVACVFTFGGQNNTSTLKIYVDGQLEATETYTETQSMYYINAEQSTIARYYNDGWPDTMQGVIESVSMADEVLTPDEFELYDSTEPIDANIIYMVKFDNLSTGTAPNTFTVGAGEISPADWVAYTPNQNMIVSTPQGKGLEVVPGDWSNGPFCGYKLAANSTQLQLTQPGDGVTYEIVAQFDNVTGKVFGGGWNLYARMHIIADSGDNAYLQFDNGTPVATTDLLPICDGQYHHVAGVFTFGGQNNTSTLKIYVDGQLEATASYTETQSMYYVNAEQSTIARYYGDGWPDTMQGVIESASMVQGALIPESFVLMQQQQQPEEEQPIGVLIDDFSELANGSGGSLAGIDANTGQWNSQNFSKWKVVDAGGTHGNAMAIAVFDTPMQISMGRAHGQDVSSAKWIEMSVDVKAEGLNNPNKDSYVINRMFWISDANQNGYGVFFSSYKGINEFENLRNSLCALKCFDGTYPFGSWGPAVSVAGSPYWHEDVIRPAGFDFYYTSADWPYATKEWMTIHIRLEQSAPGEPVKFTAWITGLGEHNSSYLDPIMQVIDNGQTFSAGDPRYYVTNIYDITKLTHIGHTAYNHDVDNDTWYNLIDNVRLDVSDSNEIEQPSGIVTIDAATPYNVSGYDDLARAKGMYSGVDAGGGYGIDEHEWPLVEPLGIMSLRACNVTNSSYLNGTELVPGELRQHLWSAHRRNLIPHIIVGQKAPTPPDGSYPHTYFPPNAGDWNSTDWSNYASYAYKVIKYAAMFQSDNNLPVGFGEIMIELENEPDGYWATATWWRNGTFPNGSREFYDALYVIYKVWANAADQVASETPQTVIKIGGLATVSPQTWPLWLIENCALDGTRLDFIGFHHYSQIVGNRGNPRLAPLQIQNIRQALDGSGFSNTEIVITEWGPFEYPHFVNSQPLGVAWTAGFILEKLKFVDYADFLRVNNDWEWKWPGYISWQGNYILGIGNLFKMFQMMPGSRVQITESNLPRSLKGGIASADSQSVGLILYNYRGWFNTGLNAPCYDLSNEESVQIKIDNLPFASSNATIQRYVIDANHSNVYSMYAAKSLPVDANFAGLAKIEQFDVAVSNGAVTLPRTTMEPSQVSLWLITPADTTSPSPTSTTWASSPAALSSTSITMTASSASDSSGIEYYFQCTAGNGHDSGWQESATYIDTGLGLNTQYTYRVKARDKSANQNETNYSQTASATTLSQIPYPTIPQWASLPTAVSSTSISMTAAMSSCPAMFVEDFQSAWSNNSQGNLGFAAGHNGWLGTNAMHAYSLGTEGANKYLAPINDAPSAYIRWITAGKPHGIDMRNVTALELSFKVKTFAGGNTQPVLWFSDPMQNGYGIHMYRNQAAIIKYSGNITDFGAVQKYYYPYWDPNPNVAHWINPDGEGSGTAAYVGNWYDGWITIHLRLEQSAPGQQITMKMWFTGSNIADTSYSSPAQTKIDNGSGTGEFSANVIDIQNLTWMGITNNLTGTGQVVGVDDITATLPNTVSNPSNVQYSFECTSGGGHNSGWQSSQTYTDTGLSGSSEYTYRFKMRDATSLMETSYSSSESAVTP